MRTVIITGPESTGKSTLTAQLAAHYATVGAPEYARQYLEEQGPRYTLTDLEAIARGQLRAQAAAAAEAARRGRPVVFADTDLLVIKVWAEHAFGHCPAWIVAELQDQRPDLVLLPNVDLPWEPDPLREHPHAREYFLDVYRRELRALGAPVVEISGLAEERLRQAQAAVDALLRTADSASPRANDDVARTL